MTYAAALGSPSSSPFTYWKTVGMKPLDPPKCPPTLRLPRRGPERELSTKEIFLRVGSILPLISSIFDVAGSNQLALSEGK